jgi:hypothetical protein
MSKRSICLTVFTVMATLSVAFTASAQSADPWFGTWKLNLEKSKYSPGPPPKSFVRKMEPADGGLKETNEVINQQGQTTHGEIIARFDGKDYAVKGGAVPDTTRAYTRLDDRTFQFVTKVDGRVTTTIRSIHSPDGRTATATVTGKDAQGQTVNNTTVWDRQ